MFKNILFASLLIAAMPASYASNSGASNSGVSDSGKILVEAVAMEQSEIVIKVIDERPVQNLCPYYLKRMEHLSALHALSLEFDSQKPCPFDVYGKRKGIFKWKVPATVLGHDRLRLLLNGVDAGWLRFDSGQVVFNAKN